MPVFKCRLKKPKWYCLASTCSSHGWINLAPFDWDKKQNLHFTVYVDNAIPVDIRLCDTTSKYIDAELLCNIRWSQERKTQTITMIERVLDLNRDLTELYDLACTINPAIASLISNGAGRLLHSSSVWEDAMKTLFTTNCSWSLTKIMATRACTRDFSEASPLGHYPFPLPEKLLRKQESTIKEKMNVGYRARYVKQMAKIFSSRNSNISLELEKFSRHELEVFFKSIPGFGEYAKNHMMLLTGHYRSIPIDSVVRTYIQRVHHATDTQKFVQEYYAPWGDYQWWSMKLEMMLNKRNWLGE